MVLSLLPQEHFDALRVRIEPILASPDEGDYTFGRYPVELPPLPGIDARHDHETGHLVIEIDKTRYEDPARLTLWARRADHPGFRQIEDGAGIAIALGLGSPLSDPDQRSLGALAHIAAEPVSAMLADQNQRSIGRAYQDAMERIGARRLVGAVRPAMAVSLASDKTPRHDLVGVAPWIFEASPHAYQELPEASGLAALSRILTLNALEGVPDPEGDAPVGTWLVRLVEDDGLPVALSADTLKKAFAAMRFRLKESDLGLLLSDEALGISCACLCRTWVEEIEALRNFDAGGGGDARPVRIAAAIERFARAAALGRTSRHLESLAFRTGLSHPEVGECLTLMLRAGIEIFVYFRTLWSQATAEKGNRT